MSRPLVAFDMEVYPNYTLLMFKRFDGGTDTVEQFNRGSLALGPIRKMITSSTLVTFNGTGYDIPLLMYCLQGKNAAEVHAASDRIIFDNMKWWNFERTFKVKTQHPLLDHIDLMEVAPLKGSLKAYGARMHALVLQDSPIPPGTVLKWEDLDGIRAYCENDVQTTIDLYKTLSEQIELRKSMSVTYGVDLRSKSDAQMAEAVIKHEIEKIQGRKIEPPGMGSGDKFAYKIPSWMQFRKLDILDRIREARFVVADKGGVLMPKELADLKVTIGTGVYRMGIGGLHSSETKQIVEADAEHCILDFDVASYYPKIVLNNRLYPRHIGTDFLTVYQGLVTKRLAAKAAKQKIVAESLKICVNGTFGKLGSKYSALYSPDLMVQVTVTGQLALLMLIESFWQIPGCEVISANTDGVTVRCLRSVEARVVEAAAEWELITEFTLERNDYSGLYSRDVNNYIAQKTNGEIKTKGVYSVGLPLQKNPYAHICSKAVIDYLTLGASIHGTVEACTDVREFVCVRAVKGGAVYRGEELGRVARWYYAEDTEEAIHYKINGYLVPNTKGAKPLMRIERYDQLPEYLNREWYVQEAENMLKDMGVVT